jgi:predicted metal-binding membrane protein
MTADSPVERWIRRDRRISAAALVVLCATAWVYVITNSDAAPALYRLFGLSGDAAANAEAAMSRAMPMEGPDAGELGLAVIMWWAMMVAMMVPAASPFVLEYARINRAAAPWRARPLRDAACFVVGYLAVWLGFSIVAALVQSAWQHLSLVGDATFHKHSAWLAAGLFATAGAYQFLPPQQACLNHCRAPAVSVVTGYRTGALGALRLGLKRGAWCVGCCWLLMALLFEGGVMNLLWIVLLTIIVFAQATLPHGRLFARLVGVALVASAVLVIVRA